ncbi:MAG: hypothetical protein PHH28_04065 [Desulfuromonadaceae bacterium]|nr:hypothetical protein [Desulfuromonadaceae bacterium]
MFNIVLKVPNDARQKQVLSDVFNILDTKVGVNALTLGDIARESDESAGKRLRKRENNRRYHEVCVLKGLLHGADQDGAGN